MAVPAGVLAVGWIPFVVVLLLILLFAFSYIRYYQSHYESEISSTITAYMALAVALFTAALVPVDIFLVSYMKHQDGTFKDWASAAADRQSIIDTVLYAYYVFYILQIVFMFLILPFVYFYYEEKEDDMPNRARCCSALKFSVGFVLFVLVLLLVGAFVPMGRDVPTNGTSEWDRIAFLFKELRSNNGQEAISFTVSVLSLIGMITLIVYTSYGMSALPIGLIRGHRSAHKERREVQDRRAGMRARMDALKEKYRGGSQVSSRDQARLDSLRDQEFVSGRQESQLVNVQNSWLNKCCTLIRPVEILLGVLLCLITLLVFVSLILTNVDKAMHSLGYKFGYALPNASLPNPIDLMLVFTQQVFPLDYILMSGLIMYFFFCTMSGVRNMGIWFLWLRLYKIRPRRTKPQGLLFMCMIMMFVVLAINVILYEIAPQYSVYGSQHYQTNWTDMSRNDTRQQTLLCTMMAPSDLCIMTRMTMLLTQYFYKVWFFGACYYWGSWLFVAVFVIGFTVTVFRQRRSSIDGHVESDDIDDSDEDLVSA